MNIESLSIAQMIADSQQGESAAKSAALGIGGLDLSISKKPKPVTPKEDSTGSALFHQDKLNQIKSAADLEAQKKAVLSASPEASAGYLDSFIKVIGGIS